MSFGDRIFPAPNLQRNGSPVSVKRAQTLDLKNRCRTILSLADVQIKGSRPWDIQVNNYRFFARLLGEGSLGLGESYMDGWWDCKALGIGCGSRETVHSRGLAQLRHRLWHNPDALVPEFRP